MQKLLQASIPTQGVALVVAVSKQEWRHDEQIAVRRENVLELLSSVDESCYYVTYY